MQSLNTHKTWIKSKELSSLLNVSERTVRNYVKTINQIYKNKPVISSELGYRINPSLTESDLEFLIDQLDEDLPINRVFTILRKLILSDSAIALADLEDELFISTSTLENDLRKTKRLISEYQAELQRTDNSIVLVADEIHGVN